MAITVPLKAIRAKCIDCSGGSAEKVKLCAVQDCPLFAFRAGRNPYRTKRQLTDEQKAKLRAQLERGRATRAANGGAR